MSGPATPALSEAERELRLEAVRLAVDSAPNGATPDDIVAAAEAILRFVEGRCNG